MKKLFLQLAGAALLLTAAAPASAADGVQIAQVDGTAGTVRVVVSVPAGETVDPASLKLDADGRALAVQVAAPEAAKVTRTAVLVLDTSGSMRGAAMTAARAAAHTFLQAIPADVRVGLVSFADKSSVRVTPTTSRAAVATAVDALSATGETSLYDAVVTAAGVVGRSGLRSLVVLSDGADTTSVATSAAAASAAKAAGAAVHAVLLGPGGANVLADLARATGGRAVSVASAGELGAVFRAVASDIGRQLVLTAPVPADLAGRQVTLTVRGTSASGTTSDQVTTTLAAAAAVALPPSTPLPVSVAGTPGWLLVLGLGAVFAGLAGLLALSLGVGADGRRGRIARRLDGHTLRTTNEAVEPGALGESAVARSAVELAGRVVRRRDFEADLALRLEAAGLPLRPAEWLLLHAGGTFAATVIALVVSGGRATSAGIVLVLGVVAPLAYLRHRAEKRRNQFAGQIPDTLQLLSGSMSAGYSFPQACDIVVREGLEPISVEFGRALASTRLGVPIEDALDVVAERMKSRDFGWVVMAVRIHREIGGSLAEVLTTAGHTLRERERVRRQVRTLSAEGRLSAYILGGLPPVFLIYLSLVRPSYLSPLFHDPLGLAMLAGMCVSLAVGFLWLKAVSKVDV